MHPKVHFSADMSSHGTKGTRSGRDDDLARFSWSVAAQQRRLAWLEPAGPVRDEGGSGDLLHAHVVAAVGRNQGEIESRQLLCSRSRVCHRSGDRGVHGRGNASVPNRMDSGEMRRRALARHVWNLHAGRRVGSHERLVVMAAGRVVDCRVRFQTDFRQIPAIARYGWAPECDGSGRQIFLRGPSGCWRLLAS